MRLLRTLWSSVRNIFSAELPDLEFPTELVRRSNRTSPIRIVALVANRRDSGLLSRLGAEQGWAIQFAGTCGEAWDLLNGLKAPIFLCDRDFPGAEWRDVIQIASSTSHRAYVILVSRVADDYVWNEVIRRGGHDLLPTPLGEEDVLRAIRFAWSWSTSTQIPPVLVKHHS